MDVIRKVCFILILVALVSFMGGLASAEEKVAEEIAETTETVAEEAAEEAETVAEEAAEEAETVAEEANVKVSINTATAEELSTLEGIGEMKAASIIEVRDNHGNFTKIEDLKNVKGIGDKIFEKIKDQITVE